jgi:hypothetical protein
MNHKDEKFDKLKRWVIGISGVGMAIASIILSKQGVGITGDLAWIGTVVALSLFCAELMFNSNFDELNWTILFLGLGAYIYSIWTNVQGFYFYRGIEGTLFTNFDTTSFFGGIFMDVYPELAIAWAMGASKIGDLIGNVVKTSKDPDKLTQAKSSTNNSSSQNKNIQSAKIRDDVISTLRNSTQKYPTQHKVTMPRGEDDDEMMSRAA